jgi:hypothetical protein
MDGAEHDQEKIERLRRAMYSRTLSPNIKDKPRREFETAEPVVGDDFIHRDTGVPQSVVAPRTIGVARVVLWWILGAAVVFFIAAVGFFAYYFFLGGGSGNASSNNISITVSGPPQVQGGEPTELQVSVANHNTIPLELADLLITYPDGTRSPSDFSTQLPSQRISLGTIEAGGVRQGAVSAVLAGNAGDSSDIKIELEYHIAGSSAIFVSSTDYNLTFSSSPLSISVDGNSETISGQPVSLTVNVVSNANDPVRDVLLSAQYPFGFKFSSASPAPDQNGFWELGDLAPGAQKSVTIQGSLTGAQGDQRIFHFNAGTRSSATSTAIDTSLANSTYTIAISQPFLGLAISVNGASGSGVVVSPGDTVMVSVAWQNNLPTAITNAVIVANILGVPIDGTTVKSSNGFYRSTDGVELWDKTTDPELATLAPGAHGVASFSFQMPASETLKSIQNPSLTVSVNAAGNRLSETGVPQNLQAATSQKIAVASDLQLSAQALYYSNPFGSTGPMPPKAGTETTYTLVMTVTNTTNNINGAAVTADLPSYVRWVGIRSPATEKVYFDGKLYDNGQILPPPAGDPCQGTSGVCWSLGDVLSGVGLNGTAPRRAAIEIGITPSTSQIGQQPALLQNLTLTGVDASTEASITRQATPDLTTNLTLYARSSSDILLTPDTGFSSANATVVK